MLPSPRPSGQAPQSALLTGVRMFSSWRWVLIWQSEGIAQWDSPGHWEHGYLATPQPGMALWSCVGCTLKRTPWKFPERADLLNDDALPKGSSAGQLTDLAWCGQQDVPLRAEWGSSSPWNATLLAPCPGQLLPFPSKCLPLHLGIQATVSKTAPYKAVRCKMVACHVPLNN